uniref:Uncharacterized protein n=1 Tax=Loa loa TaxID=7209 RepID=A0A1I7V8W4_LOALO
MCSSRFLLITNRIGYFGGKEKGLDTSFPCEIGRVEALEEEGRALKDDESASERRGGQQCGVRPSDGENRSLLS